MHVEKIKKVLGSTINSILQENNIPFSELQEIMLRIGKPLIIVSDNIEFVLHKIIEKEELMEILEYVSNYSLYAFENELKQGFITIEGGHRVGMTGQVQIEDGEVKNIKHISSMNIRISHEVLNCADVIFPYITEDKQICNTLIISPPRCGKTTMLRDLIRQVSDGNRWVRGCTVGVVDERSELGGCYLGVPQNKLGMRTDILDCCPKSKGMLMLVRSMAPQVIAVDEIGSAEDIHALEYAMHCGCKMLATVHGTSMEEIRKKPILDELIKRHKFERYVVLGNTHHIGEIEGIYVKQGITPVIAHVDRYIGPFRTFGIPEKLEDLPVLVQANAEFFLERHTSSLALRMLKKNRIHLLGSDCHDLTSRKPNLQDAVTLIHRRLGGDALEGILACQRDVLADE